MKKLSILACLIVAFATLGACSSSSQSTESEETATQQKLEEQEDESEASKEEAEAEDTESEEASEKAKAEMQSHDWCPASVEGINAEAKKGEGKMSLALSSDANPAEVRKRAKMMVEHHNKMHEHHGEKAHKGKGKGEGKAKGHGKGMKEGKGHGVMGMASAEYEESETGAMIHFMPAKAEHMSGLEKQVQKQAKWINEGNCPSGKMMKGKKSKKAKKSKAESAEPAEGDDDKKEASDE